MAPYKMDNRIFIGSGVRTKVPVSSVSHAACIYQRAKLGYCKPWELPRAVMAIEVKMAISDGEHTIRCRSEPRARKEYTNVL